jgi:hypothetical protein
MFVLELSLVTFAYFFVEDTGNHMGLEKRSSDGLVIKMNFDWKV